MKIISLLAVLMLLLVACTSQPNVQTTPEVNNEPAEETIQEENSAETPTVTEEPVIETAPEADIIIVGGKLDPEEIVIKNNEETTLTFHNTDDVNYRLDIPVYGSEITEDIDAGAYTTVTLAPNNVGYVSIKLNVAAVGTLKVE